MKKIKSVKDYIFYTSINTSIKIKRTVDRFFKGVKQRSKYQRNKKHTVFVTGDVGKLGTYVCDKLSSEFNLIGYDKAVNPAESLNNFRFLKRKMRGADYVVHLAAIPHPRKGPIDGYFKINVQGTLYVLRASIENGVKRFIFISSTGYYGCDIEGKLYPKYLPIDEKHPVASTPGISKGSLNEYNQSKVMAEELCAYFGTNDLIEVIVLRSGPANENEYQYPPEFDWRKCFDFRRGAFWSINHPKNVANAVYLAIKSKKRFTYEPFNLVNKYTDRKIDVEKFVQEEYPEVEMRVSLKSNPSLIDTRKIERVLGFKSIDAKLKRTRKRQK